MEDWMALGEGVKVWLNPAKAGTNGNYVIVGGTGCGKTDSYVIPRLLATTERSLIVSVTKRNVIDILAPVFKERGYRTAVVDFVQPKDTVLSFDSLHSVHSSQDIQALADALVRSSSDKGKGSGNLADQFWDNSAVSLLSALIAFVKKTKKDPTFTDVYIAFFSLEIEGINGSDDVFSTSLDDAFEELAEDPDNFHIISWWRNFHTNPTKTAKCIYTDLAAALDYMFTEELLESFVAKPTVDFKEIGQQKTVLFVYTSAVRPAMNHFVKIFFSEAIKDLFEYAESLPERCLPVPVDIICDDFANGGRIQNFPEYISIFREKGISVSIIIQSESQLRSMYGKDDAVTILNNCDTYIYMGGMDVETIASVSVMANVPQEDVLYLPKGQMYIIRRGEKAVRTRRCQLTDNPRYQEAMEKYQRANGSNPGITPDNC